MKFFLPIFVLALALARGAAANESTPAESQKQPRVGIRLEAFELRDTRGLVHTLEEFAESKLLVIAFLGNDCPVAKLYAPRLVELEKEFSAKGVRFIGVNSNSHDSLTETAAYATAHGVEFPILKDPSAELADRLEAKRTPEVFLLDADRVTRYRGRVDDQFIVGRKRPHPTRRDLAEAITELLDGKEVSMPVTEPAGCHIARSPKRAPTGDITYANQISRLLNDRCVRCHRPGEIAPFPLQSFADASGWSETILETTREGRMPPWFANPEHGKFSNDVRLTEDEKHLLETWVANGCPEGDPANLPEPPRFAEGWQIRHPDQVIHIADEPVKVPATGVVEYQYFTVDPGFTEDKWISAAEARPDNRAVVHHVVAIFLNPGQKNFTEARGGMVGYAPGMPPSFYPEGSALFVPAGSKILFQMHYTPNGTEQLDRSSLGLVFADPKTIRHKISGGKVQVRPWSLRIKPELDHQEFTAERVMREDLRLVTLTPHMHLRGQSFRYQAEYPDGRVEILLDVPRFDFDWQLRYELAEPKFLPRGTKLTCVAHFDNSSKNLANPDPSKPVRWGDQTWDEMMIGYYSALPVESSAELAPMDDDDEDEDETEPKVTGG